MTHSTLREPHLLGPSLRGTYSKEVVRHSETDWPMPTLGHPGTCGRDKVCYFYLFDNSGSMFGGNDPVGKRFEEVRYALEHMSRYCTCDRHLSSVVHFDTPTSGDVKPAKLGKIGLAALSKGLAVPPDGAGISMLGPSLRQVQSLIQKHPEFVPVVTILSDFELFDRPSVVEQLPNFDGVVHAVVFRSQPPQVLVDDPDVLVTRVQLGDSPGAVAQAIFQSMTVLRRPPRRRPSKKEELTW